MIETILISLIFCKIKKLKIKPLFKSWTIYPVLFMELVYLFVQANILMENYWVINYVGILKTLYLCSYLPMIFKYRQYISAIIGSIFVIIGGLLNDIAISANNGFMPVFPTLSFFTGYAKIEAFDKVNDIHILGDYTTKLKLLTDIFDIGYSVLSIGDIFIRVYVFLVIYNVVKQLNTSKEKII
ncbi:DUF5317 domain-containing protein [Clostridium sp. DSM 100503]|uniref:DUF5317 domain-containing protein n=1 Tax=Clostridium sp. DSM 100503 TaxID=2963282 RepID=UPI00214A6A47|nr:DUF5317 domain-containing protein [Clostridium sp. DSM 100503]MCR1951712.1 DUF5317 domain-containing protein [Clostridium sp. DSM 100503]